MKKWMLKKHIKKEDGQSIVEAALVLPLLILVLCGILDFGWIFAHQIMINSASRDAARYAAIHYNDTDLQNKVSTRIQENNGMGGGDDLVITINKTADGDVEVRIVKELKVLTPLAGIFVSDQIVTLNAVTVMWAG